MKKMLKKSIALLISVLMLTSCTQSLPNDPEPDTSFSDTTGSVTDVLSEPSATDPPPQTTTKPAHQTTPSAPQTETEAPADNTSEELTASETTAAVENITKEPSEMEKTDSTPQTTSKITEIEFTEVEAPPATVSTDSFASGTSAVTLRPLTPAGAFTAICEIPSTWSDGGKYCGTCNFTVTNGTGSVTDGWTVTITVPKGFEVTDSWNGVFTLNGTALTVTNESYNGTIEKGKTANFGFNFASPEEIKTFVSIATNSGVPTIGLHHGENEADTTVSASTAAETNAAPLPAPAKVGLVKEHGKLSVKGSQLIDKNGDNFQLKGMSTHGLSWFPDFVNKSAFKTLRDDWNTNVIRLAMYTAEYGGYCSGGSRSELKKLIDKGVKAASDLGMYVIIDWHILSDGNPQTNKSEALKFFEEMSSKYKNYDNVLYEICNEPNGGTSWDNDIKPYAEEVIGVIRKNSPDSVIIVGTPTWSQDIDKAAANPLTESNILYALHFYAATHTDWLRQRLTDCYNKGLPVMVTEFGTCDASGNGAYDFEQSKQWLNLLDKYGISYMNWNLANKNESSSAFKENASAKGDWKESELSEGGAWIRKWFRGEIGE